MSISGGIHTAFDRGLAVGCTTMQVFTKSNTQWIAKPLTEEDIRNYKIHEQKSRIHPIVAHDCYLINLCAGDPTILRKSREAFRDELERCKLLGIPYLVFHPGAHMGRGETEGIKLIAGSLNLIHEQTRGCTVKSVIETTAGQGTTVGYRFEHLREIIDQVEEKDRIGVCADTCHLFAAGYDIGTEEGYEKTIQEFEDGIGLERLVAFHVNDSKRELGSRVDRHEHIGQGTIGDVGFRLLMKDPRFQAIPKILETPKGPEMKEDVMNLARLRSYLNH